MKIPFFHREKQLNTEAVFATDVGLKRSNNEDNGMSLSGSQSPAGIQGILVVADGMGGHDAGEIASAIAVNSLLRQLTNIDEDITTPEGGYEELIVQMVKTANNEIRQQSQNNNRHRMGTTCTVCVIKDGEANIAHVGDSRAYLLRDSNLIQLTSDHSLVAEQVAAGTLTKEEALVHPKKNVITRALGIDDQVKCDSASFKLIDKDVLVVSSDGLHGVVPESEIQEHLSKGSIEKGVKRLIEKALELGGPDNVTISACVVSK